MEAFRFGFTFPIQKKAAIISAKALGLPVPVPVRVQTKFVPKKHYNLKRRRTRCVRTVIVPPPAKKMKMYTPPPAFEIEMTNMFELLDM